MGKAILNILTPRGELTGIPFFINCIIIRLAGMILNYIGLYITFNQLTDIPAIKAFSAVLFLLTLYVMLVVIFNYKRRLLNITGNMAVSVTLAILFTVVLDLFILLVYFNIILYAFEFVFIPLILSVIPSKDANKKEYWTTFGNRTKSFIKSPVTIFVIVMLFADFGLLKYSQYRNYKISLITPNEKMEKLVINPLSVYTGKTKNDILKIREGFVKTSMFNNANYAPDQKVFGLIADKKPWWGIDYIICTDKNTPVNKRGNGLSEESRYINNPNLLVGVQMSKSFIKTADLKDFCSDRSLLFIPESINYDKENKLIIVKYKGSKNILKKMNKRGIEYILVGLNAKDFGYEWVYANNYNNILFAPRSLDEKMVNKKPQMFYDSVRLGHACGIEGGCNNTSPYQPNMTFMFKNLPANMTLSLWKNKPIFKNQPADIYLKMIFE